MNGKKVVFTKHASVRFFERNIPLKNVEKMMAKSVKLSDPISGATLYVFKYENTHYTLVISEDDDKVDVITGYESSKWQIEHFQKVKKYGVKML